MEEEVKKRKSKVNSSSKVRKKDVEISNDELLEQIMNKKKTKKESKATKKATGTVKVELNKKESNEALPLNEKKNTKKSSSKKTSSKTSSSKKNSTKKTIKNELTDDELLSSIVEKKKAKSVKRTAKSSVNKEVKKPENNQSVDLNEQDNLKAAKDLNEHKEVNDDKNTVNNKKNQNNESNQSYSDDLIITRKITFDDEKLNLKSKKTLKELRKAIEEFDRLETLSEIANSSDKINDSKFDTSIDQEETIKENQDLFKTSKMVLDRRSNRYQKDNKKGDISLSSSIVEEENFDSDINDVNQDGNDESDYLRSFGSFETQEVRPKRSKKKLHIDKNIIVVTIFVLLIVLLFFIFVTYINRIKESYANKIEPDIVDVIDSKHDVNSAEQLEQEKKYNECINAPFSEALDYTDDFMEYSLEVLDYISNNYKASVVYENLATGYSISVLPDSVYYAASTIKALGALYIYTGAEKGEINLDETIKYESKYKYKASKGMEQHSFGDEVTIRELVNYSIIYSDNSAHQMLMDYIGNPTLREFGLSLGARYTLQSSTENFGNISGWDALIYIKAINEFINENPVLGAELKEMFIKAEQNGLEITELGIQAAHKYGSYGSYYHDYGIVYAESPYVVVILTTEGKGDYQAKVRDINRHIYELNQLLTNNRKNRCQTEVYG